MIPNFYCLFACFLDPELYSDVQLEVTKYFMVENEIKKISSQYDNENGLATFIVSSKEPFQNNPERAIERIIAQFKIKNHFFYTNSNSSPKAIPQYFKFWVIKVDDSQSALYQTTLNEINSWFLTDKIYNCYVKRGFSKCRYILIVNYDELPDKLTKRMKELMSNYEVLFSL